VTVAVITWGWVIEGGSWTEEDEGETDEEVEDASIFDVGDSDLTKVVVVGPRVGDEGISEGSARFDGISSIVKENLFRISSIEILSDWATIKLTNPRINSVFILNTEKLQL
jgi:hypothetical protein